MQKKILVILSKAPHGENNALEGLQFILMSAAYEQEVSVFFIGDGVFVLKKNQDVSLLQSREVLLSYLSTQEYKIENFYVDAQSLRERNLHTQDLELEVQAVEKKEVCEILEYNDFIISF